MSWPKVKLADCTEIFSGATPRTNQSEYWNGSIPWITPKDLGGYESKYIDRTEKYITDAGFLNCSTNLLPVNSVMMSSRAPIGHVAINTVPMCTNQGFKSLVPNREILEADYLYYWIKANKDFLQNLGVGATFKEISKAIVANIEIPLPPLETQRRIAAILDQADALRQKRQQAIAKLDELVQATFIDMFGDPVTNPKGWDTKPLVNLVDFKGGGTPSRANPQYWNGPIPWITVKDFKERIFIDSAAEHITELGVKNSATNIITSGTIIMPTRMGLGKFAITQVDAAINQDLKALTLKDESSIINDYLIFFLISQKQRIISLGKGATVKGVTLNDLYPISVAIPPMQLQKKWADFFSKSRNQKDSLNTQIKQMEILFQSLQHQAFNGELT